MGYNIDAKREVKCEKCGNQFIVYLSRVKLGGGKFCSKSCASKVNRLGKRHSVETKSKISEANLVRFELEENHPRWQGDKVSYRALHKWVQKHLGEPNYCENCKKTNLGHRYYHWANISGDYKRDVGDWKRLCAKCHKAFDKKNV